MSSDTSVELPLLGEGWTPEKQGPPPENPCLRRVIGAFSLFLNAETLGYTEP